MKNIFLIASLLVSINLSSQNLTVAEIGKQAPEFTLKTVFNKKIKLSDFQNNKNVVLVVLRGWPGYQCPICTKQVGSLISAETDFQKNNAAVIMIYPGPSENLKNYAAEFAESFHFPENYYFLLDPDYNMIHKYNLRWDAPKETAYPSTFVIDKNGTIQFSKISKTHGGRASIEEILNSF